MEQKVQAEEGLSLFDIIRLLLSKIKILILVVAISGIAGGLLAIRQTKDINYWGTSVDFYINPYNEESDTDSESQYALYGAYGVHVMDGMVRLLRSDSFAEQLMLDGATLPASAADWTANETEATALQEKIDAANAALKTSAEATTARLAATENNEKALTKLNHQWTALYVNGIVKHAAFNEIEYQTIISSLSNADAIKTLQELYNTVYDETTGTEAIMELAKLQATDASKTALEAKNAALNAWRQTASYRSTLGSFKGAISYKYLGENDIENAQQLAKSFIYVSISVLDNEAFANLLLERIKKVVPMYVEQYMPVPAGYDGTNCQITSTASSIHLTNPGYMRNQAIKMGILFGLVAAVIACVIIIVIDRSDKRLRDHEVITKVFNVPVLGVVPTIDTDAIISKKAKLKEVNTEAKK